MENKLAVIFPGIGYHTDKPLLYYGKKLVKNDLLSLKNWKNKSI